MCKERMGLLPLSNEPTIPDRDRERESVCVCVYVHFFPIAYVATKVL